MSITRKLVYILFTLRMFRNWREILTRLIKNAPPTFHVLRDGTIIHSADDIMVVIDEVFDNDLYSHDLIPLSLKDEVIIDIGAHVGVFTLWAYKKTNAKIVAVEPLPSNYNLLVKNIHSNGLKNTVTLNKAVAATARPIRLTTNQSSSGNHTFSESSIFSTDDSIIVECLTLGELIDLHELTYIDLLKMDCEGAEGEILQSTPDRYFHKICKIVLEFHDAHSALNHDAIEQFLREHGYDVQIRWDGISSYGYIFAAKSE